MGSRRLFAALALVVAVFALYAQTARHSFVDYDTGVYLTENVHVLRGLSWENVRWAFSTFEAANWHPLTWLSHMLDVQMFELHPAGHHLENAAWHAANAVLVLALFERLGLARAFAFAGALLFAIHPLRAESVAWVVERKDLLSAFFGLASLLAWLSGSRVAALALYACSLMSKPMLVTLPCLLLLLDWWPLQRKPGLATLGFFALALAASVVTVRAQSAGGAVQALANWPVGLRVENALDAYVWYAAKTLWPTGLVFHYPLTEADLGAGRLILDAGVLLVLSAAAWLARQRLPGVLFGWLWFLGTLVPVIGIVQVGGAAHADRYTYLPGIGLVFALCHVAERELLPRLRARPLAALGLCAAAALALQSWRQIGTWRDSETLARHALASTRDNLVACDVLGSYYSNHGRVREALPLLREAVRLAPNDAETLTNLAGTLMLTGERQEVGALLQRAIQAAPRRWQAWSVLGALHLAEQRPQEALTAFDRALELEPGHSGTWLNRGRTLEALGRADEARESYARARAAEPLPLLREAVRKAPQDPEALTNLAGTLLREGQLEEVGPLLQRAIQLAPRRWQAWSLLGALHLAEQRPAEALPAFDRALELEPGHGGTWENRGRTLQALGRHGEAQDSFERARAASSSGVR